MTKEKKTVKRLLLAALVSASTALLALIIYFSIVPIDLTGQRQRIEAFIESRTGRDIALDTVIVKVFPSPEVNLGKLSVYHNGKTLLSAGSASFTLRVLPLLAKDIVIEKLHLDGPRLFVTRRKDESTTIREFIESGRKKAEGEKEGFKLRVTSVTVANGYLLFIDERPELKSAFEFSEINAELAEEDGGHKYSFNSRLLPESSVTVSGKTIPGGVVSGRALLSPFDLSRFTPYMDMRSPGASLEGMGVFDVTYTRDGGLSFKSNTSYSKLKLTYPKILNDTLASEKGSGIVGISTGAGKIDVTVDNALLKFNGFDVKGSFALTGPQGDKELSLAVSSTPVPLTTVKSLAPLKVLPPRAKEMAESITPSAGLVEVKHLVLKGPLRDIRSKGALNKIRFELGVGFSGLGFRYKGFKNAFDGLDGEFTLINDDLSVKGLSGRYGKELVKFLKGSARDLTGKIVYDVSTEGILDLSETLEIAHKVFEDSPHMKERLNKLDAGGSVDLSLTAKGTAGGKRETVYSGTAFIDNARFSYEELPVSFESLSGDLVFDNKTVEIKGVRASDGYSEVSLRGHVDDYLTESPYAELGLEGKASGETIMELIKGKPLGEELFTDGYALVRASIAGRPRSFSANVFLDAASAWVAYRDYVRKEDDFPATFEAAVRVEGKELTINKSRLLLGSSSLSASGGLDQGLSHYSLGLKSDGLLLADISRLVPFISKAYGSEGVLSFDLRAGKQAQEAAPVFDGTIKIADGRFSTPLLKKPVEKINASAVFEGNRAEVSIDGLTMGGSLITGKIESPDIAARVVRFEIDSPRLDTEDIVPERLSKKVEPEKEKKGPPFTGSGVVRIKEGSAWGHPFNDFSTEIEMQKDIILIRPISVNADQGSLTGYATIFRDPGAQLLFESHVDISNVELDSLIASFGTEKRIVSGRLNGKVTLNGTRGAEPFMAGLNGQASLKSEDGKLWKFPILAGVFSIVNIISIDQLLNEGMDYKELGGEFTITNGIITTQTLEFDSNAMRMAAYGDIDLPNRHIDTILVLKPFVTIDKIISNIPLAGWIITGKEESTVSLYFEIEGPLKDPDISPKPVQSVSRGVLGILERLLKAPLRLFGGDK